MSDLRTGLVEAMAEQIYEKKRDIYPASYWSGAGVESARADELAAVALDAALGFLTDNAEAWRHQRDTVALIALLQDRT